MKHLVFGMPAPLLALATTAVTGLWEDEDTRYFVVPATFLSGVFSFVHIYLNMAGKAQQHWDFSARYGGIVSKIDLQLCKDVDFRRPAAEFMAETRVEIGNLNGSAPQLPGRGCCGCSDIEREDPIPAPTAAELEADQRQAKKNLEAYLAANKLI